MQDEDNPQLVYGVYGLIGLVGAAATSFLPETHFRPLPQVVEDTDNAPRNPYFSFRVWTKETNNSPPADPENSKKNNQMMELLD